jgi:hypothetical protein
VTLRILTRVLADELERDVDRWVFAELEDQTGAATQSNLITRMLGLMFLTVVLRVTTGIASHSIQCRLFLTRCPRVRFRTVLQTRKKVTMLFMKLLFILGLQTEDQMPLNRCCLLVIAFTLGATESPRLSDTIKNNDGGRWANEEIQLAPDLTIGTEDGPEEEVLGRVLDVAVDSDYNIYVVDSGFSKVRIYDRSGKHIRSFGREGEGPGEFGLLTCIALHANRIYVGHGHTVTIFDKQGQYLDQFPVRSQGGLILGLRVTDSGIYVSSLDVLEQKVVHMYDFSFKPVVSFCDSWGAGKDMDVRVESAFGGGAIDVDSDGNILYSQMTPYEIRCFSPVGELLRTIDRKNDFMNEPEVTYLGSRMRLRMPTHSTAIVSLPDGKFINVVMKLGAEGTQPSTVLDLFNTDGHLLTSTQREENMTIKCADTMGRLYGIHYDEVPAVTRYKLSVR